MPGRIRIEPLTPICEDEACFFYGTDHFHYPEAYPVGADTRVHYRNDAVPPWAERPARIHAPVKRQGAA